jgi:hypothetical protein
VLGMRAQREHDSPIAVRVEGQRIRWCLKGQNRVRHTVERLFTGAWEAHLQRAAI